MAQGLGKLKNANVRSSVGASIKKKSNKASSSKNTSKIVKKGAKYVKPKHSSSGNNNTTTNNRNSTIALLHASEKETTKSINRKNEALMAAKAVSAGAQFKLSDIAATGKKEWNQQKKVRDKKQNKATSVADKVRKQLQKLKNCDTTTTTTSKKK